MNQEVRKATKLELDAYIYLEKKLVALRDQIAKVVSKKNQQQEAREMELMEYKTEQEIQDAYGWDFITEEEKDRLIDRLRGAKEKAELPTKEKIALDELCSILKEVCRTRNDLEYELMSDEEKQRRQEQSEEWQNKIAELRAKKEGKQ